jgi:hypothetical protein
VCRHDTQLKNGEEIIRKFPAKRLEGMRHGTERASCERLKMQPWSNGPQE